MKYLRESSFYKICMMLCDIARMLRGSMHDRKVVLSASSTQPPYDKGAQCARDQVDLSNSPLNALASIEPIKDN